MNLKLKKIILLNCLLFSMGKCIDLNEIKTNLKSDDLDTIQSTLSDLLNEKSAIFENSTSQSNAKLVQTIITQISPELITLTRHENVGIQALSSYTLCFSHEFNAEIVQALTNTINNTSNLDVKQMVLSGLGRIPKSLITDDLEATVLQNLEQDEHILSFNSAMLAASELSLLKAIPILEKKLLNDNFDIEKITNTIKNIKENHQKNTLTSPINPNLLTTNTPQTTQQEQTTQQAKAQEEQTTATPSEQQTSSWLIYALAALGLVVLSLVVKKLKNKG